MKKLPNGLMVFNGTPHTIRFWHKTWLEPVEVERDDIISARIEEQPIADAGDFLDRAQEGRGSYFVTPTFLPTEDGLDIIRSAIENAGADIVVGSIIAAQAYPGQVVAMTPCKGYERVPPAEKRMSPYKFTMFLP